MFRHLHADARNAWLNTLDTHKLQLRGQSRMEKLTILQRLAQTIRGIGPCTVYETLFWIESDQDYF